MAVFTTQHEITYTGAGQTSLPVPFPFLDPDHLRVTLIEGETETQLNRGDHYTVTGGDPNGTVTLRSPLAPGKKLRIRRVVPLTQPLHLDVNGPFDPKAIEREFDRRAMVDQQLAAGVGTYVHGNEPGGNLHARVNEFADGFFPHDRWKQLVEHLDGGGETPAHDMDEIGGLPDALDEIRQWIAGKAERPDLEELQLRVDQLPTMVDYQNLVEAIANKAPADHTHSWDQILNRPDVYDKEHIDRLFFDVHKRIDYIGVPYIGENGNWWVGRTDTGHPATGPKGDKGDPGEDGISPHIGENGNWWIGDTDTGVRAKGEDGSKWFADTGAPSGDVGSVGDFYLDTATGNFYEKTGTSTWTLRGNLKGPKGDTGDNGLTPELRQGLEAIEWRYQGAPDWSPLVPLADITGPQGPKGDKGDPGEDGTKWHLGESAPSGSLGKVGDFYLVSTTGDYYEKTGTSEWTLRGNLKGPKGDKGDPGDGGGGSGIVGIATYRWNNPAEEYELVDSSGDLVFPIKVYPLESRYALDFDEWPEYPTHFVFEAKSVLYETWLVQKYTEYWGYVTFEFIPYSPYMDPGELPERPDTFRVIVFRGPDIPEDELE